MVRRIDTALQLVLLSPCVLGACSADKPTGPYSTVDVSTVDSIAELFDVALQRYCSALFHCAVPNDDLLAMVSLLETKERCLQVYRRALESPSLARRPHALRQLEAEGRVHVDRNAVQSCYGAIGECAVPSLGSGYCRELIEGTVAAGGACSLSEECAGDAYCEFASDACPGVCKVRVGPGSACNSSDMCSGSGLNLCLNDGSTSQRHCVVSEEQVAGKLGEACAINDGEPWPCATGLFCDVPKVDGKASTSGTCSAAIALGAACDDADDVCEAGALCHGPDGAMTCQRVQRLSRGSPCTYSATEPPRFCDPFAGLTCGATGCEPVGDGSRGARCGTSDFDDLVPCKDGLHCDRESSTCEPLRSVGESCESGSQCLSGSCNALAGKCHDRYCDAF